MVEKQKPKFTLLEKPGVDEVIWLFEQLTGKKEEVSPEERKKLESLIAGRNDG